MIARVVHEVTDDVSLPELFWIVLCAVGLVRVLKGLRAAQEDEQERRALKLNGALRISYRGRIRLYRLGSVKLALYLSIGAIAALLPPRQIGVTLPHWQHLLARFANVYAPCTFICNAVLLVVMLELHTRDRMLIDRADKEDQLRKRDSARDAARDEVRDAERDVDRDVQRDVLRDSHHDSHNHGRTE